MLRRDVAITHCQKLPKRLSPALPCAPDYRPCPRGGWPQPTARSAQAAAPGGAGCPPGGEHPRCPAALRSMPAASSKDGCPTPAAAHPQRAPRPLRSRRPAAQRAATADAAGPPGRAAAHEAQKLISCTILMMMAIRVIIPTSQKILRESQNARLAKF